MGASDEQLLRRAIAGDRDALADLLEQAAPTARQALRGAIPRRWQSLLSVDDVMQQTYTDAFLAIGTFMPRGDGAFAGWLATLAKRNLLDAIRSLEAQKRGGDARQCKPGGSQESLLALYDWLTGTGSTPSRHAAQGEALAALDRSIQLLPKAYRDVIRLYDLEGRPIEEVSQALERSPGATYMLRSRAHDQLREIMGSSGKYFSAAP